MSKRISRFEGEYRFLSNFFEAELKWSGRRYPTAEHAYQAAKATNEKDMNFVIRQKTPGAAKRAGQHVTLRKDWEEVKYKIMKEIVKAKFEQNDDLKQLLLRTQDAYIEEGNDWNDKIWGTVNGRGQNLMGKILMEVRTELRLGV
jgi:ribA/ribD-fused uncharacterized protein